MSKNDDLVRRLECPKCGAISGDDWDQCEGNCPMPGSPHYATDAIERGAAQVVTDEALRAQYWNAFYGHIDAHQGNTSEASARSHASGVVDRAIFEAGESTPQPAVEAQGSVTLARFTPTPSGRMMWDKYGEWVDRSDCMRSLASEKARADRAERERDEARRHISNLLARIHRDGGHHEARIGTAQAVEDADSVVSHLFVAQDELKAAEAELAKLRSEHDELKKDNATLLAVSDLESAEILRLQEESRAWLKRALDAETQLGLSSEQRAARSQMLRVSFARPATTSKEGEA